MWWSNKVIPTIDPSIVNDIETIIAEFYLKEISLVSKDAKMLAQSRIYNLSTLNISCLATVPGREQLNALLDTGVNQWTADRLRNLCIYITLRYSKKVVDQLRNQFITALRETYNIPEDIVNRLATLHPEVWTVPFLTRCMDRQSLQKN